MKVLIVDDNVALAFVLREMLEGEGFETQVATNGAEGYLSYLRFSPDWVITDICMPVENGLEMMRKIWNHDPEVRVVYVSGDLTSFVDLLEEDGSHHEVSFLEKPFSKEDLIEILSSARKRRIAGALSGPGGYETIGRKERTHGKPRTITRFSFEASRERL